MSEPRTYRTRSGKIRTVRDATAEERASIEKGISERERWAAETHAAIRKAITPERLAAMIEKLPEEARERLFREPPVKRTVKIIYSKKARKNPPHR
jgi:hypothetical protein